MTKEVRLLFLALLTLIVYAVSIYATHGAFIFPFPLNELILLVIAVQFAYWNRKNKIPALYILGISVFAFLGNEVYWSFVLDGEMMYQFSSLPVTDIFILLSAICMIGFGVYTFLKQKNSIAKLLGVFFIILYIASITYLPPIFTFYAYICMAVSVLIQPVNKPFHLIWILLLLLETTKFLTILLNN